MSIQMQALADFAGHRAIGCAVCLKQKVDRAVDLDLGRPTRSFVTWEKRVMIAMNGPYPTP